MTIIIKIIIWTVICISNAVLLSVHVISIELPQFCEYERHTDIQPQRPYLLLAPIPVACRIRGAHGSKTACDAVRRKRNTLTRQPPFTPTPIPPPMVAPSGVEKRQSRRGQSSMASEDSYEVLPCAVVHSSLQVFMNATFLTQILMTACSCRAGHTGAANRWSGTQEGEKMRTPLTPSALEKCQVCLFLYRILQNFLVAS